MNLTRAVAWQMHNSLRIRLLASRTQAEPQAALTGSQAEVAEALVGMGADVQLLVPAAGDAQLVMPILVAMPRGECIHAGSRTGSASSPSIQGYWVMLQGSQGYPNIPP